MRSCKLPSGAEMPVLGLGTWRMGESARRRSDELDALKYGLDLVINIYQVLCCKHGGPGLNPLPLTRDYMYR